MGTLCPPCVREPACVWWAQGCPPYWDCQAAGLARDAAYLVRPDTCVAMVDGTGDRDALEAYFTARGIQSA